MFFDVFKKDLKTKPALVKDELVTYIVNEGPNGGGKSTITKLSSELAALNCYDTANLYRAMEPPEIPHPLLPAGVSVRKFLKEGMAGEDTREQLGLFMMARRQIQEDVHGSDKFMAKAIDHVTSATTNSKTMVLSDRGMQSSMIYQVRGRSQINSAEAEENLQMIEAAYKQNYLVPYDLTVTVLPKTSKNQQSADDCFEGRYDETLLYAQEISETSKNCRYSERNVWVENDPSGATNIPQEPAMCAGAAAIGTLFYGKLEKGKKYQIPFKLTEEIEDSSASKMTEIKSGNIVVTRLPRTAIVEINERVPQVR